ncbi:MAG: M56 family metallopeptidase [Cyclobacteriaceae bacterium]
MRGELIFLMEMILVSGTFYLGYRVMFNQSSPTFRRWYLLSWLLFSVAFPLITLEIPSAPPVAVEDFVMDSGSIFSEEPMVINSITPEFTIEDSKSSPDAEQQATIDWIFVLKSIYLVVVSFFLSRIALGYFQIRKLKKKANCIDYKGKKVFEVEDSTFKGASFFRWIFIGKSLDQNRKMVLDHELTHAGLHHSVDILFGHLYCALFWINPFVWILRKCIAINTEMEADARVSKTQDKKSYANLLLELSQRVSGPVLMNHFSAKHLKMRILAMQYPAEGQRWVYYFTGGVTLAAFFFISCSTGDFSDGITAEERMSNVKTITTYFTSHQTDTQQKTGKVVSIARFHPDGELDELVNRTSYPYDRQYDTKKEFWQQPIKENLPYVMDGLTIGIAERNLLYGNNWPTAYAQYLLNREAREERRLPWKEIFEVDNMSKPTEIIAKNVMEETAAVSIFNSMPDNTTYFEYDEDKILRTSVAYFYKGLDELMVGTHSKLDEWMNKSLTDKQKKEMEERAAKSGKKELVASYSYDGDLLTAIDHGRYQYKFYYERDRLIKSEYYIAGNLISTRIHYYKNGLKQRTEIFNIDFEPEYTITYEYEFWEE